jgi:hypothetical protein
MALMMGPNWVQQATASNATVLDKAPIPLAGAIIARMFGDAKLELDVRQAEAMWTKFQIRIVDYEKSLQCSSYGAAGDKEIAMTIVDDIAMRSVSLMIAVGDLILAFAQQDKDQVIDSFKDALEELKQHMIDKGIEKTKDKVGHLSEPAARRFKDTLLRWLQTYSKRSRKHYSND